jgi:predicted kinase
MKQVFINVVGYPASGKSTLIRKLSSKLTLNVIDGTPIRKLLNTEVSYYQSNQVGHSGPVNESFARVVNSWRVSLLDELLSQGQSVIVEGGINPKHRAIYGNLVKSKYPKVKIIFIHVQIDEAELLKRLKARGGDWVGLYKNYYRKVVKPPQSSEYDKLIIFDQSNNNEVTGKVEKFIGRI